MTVNSTSYVHMLEDIFPHSWMNWNYEDIWFQQEGAMVYTSRPIVELREHFPQRLTLIRENLDWPARNPNLSPCDFCMWYFEISCLCDLSKDPTELEDQHTGRNRQHKPGCAGKDHDKCQKSAYLVH